MVAANSTQDAKTVFLVEDDTLAVSLYSNRLEQAGFRIEAAEDPDKAVEAIPNLAADLIILDLLLPGRRGFDLLDAIRSDRRHRTTPVLVLSNAYLPEMAQRALKAGGNKALPRSRCTSSQLISLSRELIGGGPAALSDSDIDLTTQLRNDLVEAAQAEMASMRQCCSKYLELANPSEGKEHIEKIYHSIRLLSTRAGLADCGKIAQLTGAIEAMLFEHLSRANAPMSPSSMQTLVRSVDCVERLFGNGNIGASECTGRAKVLVVDDDEICTMANEMALKRASYDVVRAMDGGAALMILQEEEFDLILLDINMPNMSGIEVCQRLRAIPQHKNTPVVFLTLHGDFKNRVQSILSGGDDLISKPIAPMELIVKATVFLLTSARPRPVGEGSDQKPLAQKSSAGAPEGSSPEETGQHGPYGRSHALHETIGEKLKYLQEALAEETKRREGVEQQAAENTKRRARLEAAIEDNQRSGESLQQLLEQARTAEGEGKDSNLIGRRRALMEVRDFVADKLICLKRALEEEKRCREAVERQLAENAKRREELAAALQEIQGIEQAFDKEIESAINPAQLAQLQTSLEEAQKAREALEHELEAARQELQALRIGVAARESELQAEAAKCKEAQAEVDQKLASNKDKFAEEALKRHAAEREAAEARKRQTEVKALLAKEAETATRLTKELESSKSKLQAAAEGDKPGMQAELEKLRAQHSELGQKIKSLSDSLSAETRRREQAEARANKSAGTQAELQAELGRLKGKQAGVAQQLTELQKLRSSHEADAASRQSELETKRQKLQNAQAEIDGEATKLNEALAKETARIETLRRRAAEHAKFRSELEAALAENQQTEKALQREKEASENARRRGELEAELAQNKQAQDELRRDLDEARQQLRTLEEIGNSAEIARLESRVSELEGARRDVEQELTSLTTAVTQEKQGREAAEQQAASLGERRAQLEAEMARLQDQLNQAAAGSQAQHERFTAEQARIEARTKELEAAEKEVQQQLKALTTALEKESHLRKGAEQQAGESAKASQKLESDLSEIRHLLERAQQELKIQEERSKAQQSQLEARTRDLQTAHAEVKREAERLANKLVQETSKREVAEQHAGEVDQRRTELESQLGDLGQQLESSKKELQLQQQNASAQQAELERRIKELQGVETTLEERIRSLVQALAAETKKREAAEKRVEKLADTQAELETELEQARTAEAKLINQLKALHEQLDGQRNTSGAKETQLHSRISELEGARSALESSIQKLTAELKKESGQRRSAEQHAQELSRRERELEASLTENKQKLAIQQQRLQELQREKGLLEKTAGTENTSLQREIEKLDSEGAKLGREVRQLRTRVAEEHERADSAERRAAELHKQMDATDSRLATLHNELERLQKELGCHTEAANAAQATLHAHTEKLEAAKSRLEEQVRTLTQTVAEQTRSREVAERESSELALRRTKLEQQLLGLRNELEAARRDFAKQKKSSAAEQTKAEARIKEFQASKTAVEQQVLRLTDNLEQETKRREAAERQAVDIGCRRSELEANLGQVGGQLTSTREQLAAEKKLTQGLQEAQQQLRKMLQIAEDQQAKAELRRQLDETRTELEVQQKRYLADKKRIEARTKELESAEAEIERKLKEITTALEEEKKRRKGAEQIAGEVGKRRSELEAELAENKKAQEALKQELQRLEGELKKIKENFLGGQAKLEQRVKELLSRESPLDEKIRSLTQALAMETKRREVVERMAVDAFKRRRELEGKLAKMQRAEQALHQEMATSPHPQEQRDLKAQLTENKEAQAQLREQLATTVKEAAGSKPEATILDATAFHPTLLQGVKKLTESLSTETKRRQSAEGQARDLGLTKTELESQLTGLRQDLERAQKILAVQQDSSATIQAGLERKIAELQEAKADLERRAAKLDAALSDGKKAHAPAAAEVHRVTERQKALEAELIEARNAAATLQRQLEENRALQNHEQLSAAEQARMRTQVDGLQSAKAAVEQQVKSLAEDLEKETKLRQQVQVHSSELGRKCSEWEARAQETGQQLEKTRKELSVNQANSRAEQSMLASRIQDLETVKVRLEQQLEDIGKSLQSETKRSQSAEQLAKETTLQRDALQTEFKAVLEKLGDLEKKLKARQNKHGEQAALQKRLSELQSARSGIQGRLEQVENSLADEAGKRQKAENEAAEATRLRAQLEEKWGDLQKEIEELRRRFEQEQENARAYETKLAAQTRALELIKGDSEQKVQRLTADLLEQSRRGEGAEQQIRELSQRHTQYESQLVDLNSQLATARKQLQEQQENSCDEKLQLEARTQELETSRNSVEHELSRLTGLLDQEKKLRLHAETQAAENSRIKQETDARLTQLGKELEEAEAQLEAETKLRQDLQEAQKQLILFLQLADKQQAEADLRRQVDETRHELATRNADYLAEQSRLQARKKELQASESDLGGKVTSLSLALEQQKRPGQRKKGKAESDQRRQELERELAEAKKVHAALKQQLADVQQQLRKLEEHHAAEESRLQGRVEELEAARKAAEENAKSLTAALEQETKRRQVVEKMAVDAFKERRKLERQLGTAKTVRDESEPIKPAIQLRNDHAAILHGVKRLTESLTSEIRRREGAEQQVSEAAQQRGRLEAELTETKKAQLTYQSELEKTHAQLRSYEENSQAEQTKLGVRATELLSAKEELDKNLQRIAGELSEQSKRREKAEQQIREHFERRTQLESQVAELGAQLTAARKQLDQQQETSGAERLRLETRSQELETSRTTLEEQISALNNLLQEETGHRAHAEREAAENSRLKQEAEARLAHLAQESEDLQARLHAESQLRQALQEAQKQLMGFLQLADKQQTGVEARRHLEETRQELVKREAEYSAEHARLEERSRELQATESDLGRKVVSLSLALEQHKGSESKGKSGAEADQQRQQLEVELTEAKNAHAALKQQLEETQQQLRKLKEDYATEKSILHAKIKDLETERRTVEEQVESLTAAIAQETKRRELVEKMAVDAFKARRKLESRLATSDHPKAETEPLEPGKEFRNHAMILEGVKRLTQTLTAEMRRREGAEQKVRELDERRNGLESKLAGLRQEVEKTGHDLQAAQESSTAERAKWEGRVRELESGIAEANRHLEEVNAALVSEKEQHAGRTRQAAEAEQQRTRLHEELAQSRKAHLTLQSELEKAQAQLRSRQETSSAEEARLQAKLKELQASDQELTQEISRLTSALADEARQRQSAEQQLSKVQKTRVDLEKELAEARRAYEQLRAKAEALQRHLHAVQQSARSELARFEARTKGLQTNVREAEERIKQFMHELAGKDTQIKDAQQQCTEAARKRQEVETQLLDLQKQLAMAQKELNRQRETSIQAEITLQTRVRDLQLATARTEEEVRRLNDALAAETRCRKGLEKTNRESEQCRNDLELRLQKAGRQLDETREQLKQKEATSREAGVVLQARTQELESARQQVEKEVKLLTAQIAEESQLRHRAEEQRLALEKRRDALESELEQVVKSKAELDQKLKASCKELQLQRETSSAERTEMECKIRQLQSERAGLESRVQQLTSEATSGAERRETLKQQLEQITAGRNALENRLASVKSDLELVQKQLSQAENSWLAEKSDLEKRIEELHSSKQQTEDQIKAISGNLSCETQLRTAAEQKMAQLEQTRSELQGKLLQTDERAADLGKELEAARAELKTAQEHSTAEKTRLQKQVRDLKAAAKSADEQAGVLGTRLDQESQLRRTIEAELAKLDQRRSALETEAEESRKANAAVQAQLDAVKQQLEDQCLNFTAARTESEDRVRQLQSLRTDLEQEISLLTSSLTAEVEQRTTAQQQIVSLSGIRAGLEERLGKLSTELESAQTGFKEAQEHASLREAKLEAQVLGLLSDRADLEKEITRLIETVTRESSRREGLDLETRSLTQQLSEITTKLSDLDTERTRLQQELQTSETALQTTRDELTTERSHFAAEQSRSQRLTYDLQNLTHQLTVSRARIDEQTFRCADLSTKLLEAEHVKSGLTSRVAALQGELADNEGSIQTLNRQIQERDCEVKRIESLLRDETAARRLEQSEAEALHARIVDLEKRLSEMIAEDAALQQCKAGLEYHVRDQEAQLAGAASAARVQDLELNRLSAVVEESRIVQTALCARVQDLINREQTASNRIYDLEKQLKVSIATLEVRNKDLAEMRHASHEEAEVRARLAQERAQAETQIIAGWRQMTSALLQTPLSPAQRGLVIEVTAALNGWYRGRLQGHVG